MSPVIATPTIPQTRTQIVGQASPYVAPSSGVTVAIPVVTDWGPMGADQSKPVVYSQFGDLLAVYGDSDTDLRTAAAVAFTGQGLQGASGAGGVIPYRIGTGAAFATLAIQNTAAATAFTLQAKYRGTRGNLLSAIVEVDPNDSSKDRLTIRFSGAPRQRFSYARTDIATLVAAINSRVGVDVIATGSVVTGTALSPVAGTSLAGGANGTVTVTDYMAACNALEFSPFAILAPANLTDTSVMVSIRAWVLAQETANRPVVAIFGGAAGESVSTAISRQTSLADPHILTVGCGTWHADEVNKDLSTAQLAPKLAGILAARGLKQALTAAPVAGLHPVGTTAPTSFDVVTAIQNGVITFVRTDDPDADLRVAKGVTTFVSTSDPDRPFPIFSEPRFIRIFDEFIRGVRLWGDKNIVGATTNTEDTRDAVKGEIQKRIAKLISDGLVLNVASGAIADPFVNVDVSTGDTITYTFGFQLAKTVNYLLGSGTVQ